MPFQACAWARTAAGAETLIAGNALADQSLTVSGTDVIVPDVCNQLIAFWAAGAVLTAARLVSPSLRAMLMPDLEPIAATAQLSTYPEVCLMDDQPLPLVSSEALNAQFSQSAAGTAYAVALLTDKAATPDTRPCFTVRATAAVALVAGAWTNTGALVFAQSLPAGTYDIVGLRARSATCVAARLVFVGGGQRPGVPGVIAVSTVGRLNFRYGNLGIFGSFRHNQPPTLDFLATAADAAEIVYLDLVKTG